MGSWHTATAEPKLERAGHLGRGCWREGSKAVDRCAGGSPSAPVFSTMLCSSTALHFLYFYTWTANHFCVEGNEMSVQTQWLLLFLVTAGRLLHQGEGLSS